MTPPRSHSNLAARMGRWSANHWKTATFGWLAFVVVAFGLGGAIGVNNVDPNAPGPGESGRMDRILDDGFRQPADESVLIRSRSARAGTPAFDAAVTDVVVRVSRVAAVQDVHRGAVAKDGHAALVDFTIKGDKDKAVDKIQPVLDATAAAQAAHPGFTIGEFGYASAQKGVETAYGDDLGKAGALSLPITLLILVLAFGALVAAGIPLLLALTAVLATFGLIALPSQLIPVAFEAPAMVLLIGLAVGVDYSMFYLKRERQERAAGKSTEAALEAAAATSGRSVLISGLTVMVAMAGMFLTGDQVFASLGFATILVVAVAVLGSLTVLPALLSRLGDNVDRLGVPFVGRLSRGDGESRFWGAIVDRVLRRPALSAALSAGVLLALFVVTKSFKIVGQAEVMVIERLGRFHRVARSGLNILLPFIEVPRAIDVRYFESDVTGLKRVTAGHTTRIDLREQVLNFPSQPVITKDNVTIDIDAVIYYRVADPQKATYSVQNLPYALETLTRTTLRNIVGEMELERGVDLAAVKGDELLQLRRRARPFLHDSTERLPGDVDFSDRHCAAKIVACPLGRNNRKAAKRKT